MPSLKGEARKRQAAATSAGRMRRAAALASENVRRHLEGREPRKVIVVPGRLVNLVV